MQKWEYLFVHRERNVTWFNGDWQRKTQESPSTFYSYCNRLGSEGWELVGMDTMNQETSLAFKRPIE